ncbi:MAG: SurA N-terminal domain-containing protein [Coprococcus sp.]
MKKIIYIFCVLLIMGIFTGCGSRETDENEKYIVFRYNDQDIYLDEVYIYARTTIEEYEQKYGNKIWGENIVTDDGLEMNVEDTARKEVIANIVKTKTLITKADGYGISLSEREIKEQEAAADEFYNMLTDEQIAEVGMERETVVRVLKENLLAEKVYEYVMRDSNTEVSDEQARMTTFYDMFFECYSEDRFGNVVVYSADRISEQKEKAESAYASIVAEQDNPDLNIAFLGYTYDLKYAGSHTMSKEEIINTYGQETLDILYGMQDGEISPVVETEYGYHIFQMTALTDKTATAENKEKLTEEANQSYYANLITAWTAELDKGYSYSKRVNNEIYDKIIFE